MKAILLIVAMGVLIVAVALLEGESPIKDDEVVTFFPALGRPVSDAANAEWEVSIHGWIFEPEKDSIQRKVLLGLLRRSLGLEDDAPETELFKERARWFLVDNERGKRITIRLGEKKHSLDPSKPNGHFSGTLRLSSEEVSSMRRVPENADGRLRFRAVTRKDDSRVFQGEILLVQGPGLSVVTDIDDTVKVSETTDRKALLANTFLRSYSAVGGMSEVYKKLERRGAVFHYVSASPWQLYEPLSTFLATSGFPRGTFHLKEFRVKDSTFFSLFASPQDYKRSVLEPLLRSFPLRRFVLIGDSSEKDIDVYAELARALPDRVEMVLIRSVPGVEAKEDRLAAAFKGVPGAKWRVFREPAEILAWASGE